MTSATSGIREPYSRREWVVLAAVLLVAFAVRTWRLDTTSMDHYDEGVYAFSAWGLSDAARHLHPEQRNSPILHPWVTSLAFRLNGGPSDTVMLGVNVVLGTLTVLALWFVARRWFGAGAAIGAATILAANDYHIALSRSGLTDALFAIVFLWAIAAVATAIEKPQVFRAVVAGLIVGLAWNTKYHGWLSVVIVTSGLVPFAVGRRWAVADYGKAIRQLAIITVVAMACYAPWAMYLIEAFGSYSEATKYQMTFLSREWPSNFVRQAGQQLYFDGVLTRVSLPAAIVAMAFARPVWPQSIRWLGILAATSVASVLAGGTPLVWLMTAAAVPQLMGARQFATWILLAWGAIMIVMTPLYNPYARLVLPFVLASTLSSGYALSRWLPRSTSWSSPGWRPAASLAIVAVTALASIAVERHSPTWWRESRSLPNAAAAIAAQIEPGAPVLVIGEAALAFHLELAGLNAFKGFENFDLLEQEAREQYVVTGYYTRAAPPLRAGLNRLAPRLRELGRYDFIPTDFRLLDSLKPAAARAFLGAPDKRYQLTLYRYTPSAPLASAP